MAYYTRKTDRMNLHIEEYKKTILIIQRWKYVWLTAAGAPAWKYRQRRKFHNDVDLLIWNNWGKQYNLKVSANLSALAIVVN